MHPGKAAVMPSAAFCVGKGERMITANTSYSSDRPVFDFMGKSTDTKPTVTYNGKTIENGSTFYEMNTGKVFMYDADADVWLEQ